MEVQPDIIMNDGDDHEEHFDSIVEEEGVDPIQGHSQSRFERKLRETVSQ